VLPEEGGALRKIRTLGMYAPEICQNDGVAAKSAQAFCDGSYAGGM
jgi:hypothetical protein